MPFEIFQSEKTKKYYFRLKAGNGEVVLQSEAYNDRSGAEGGVQSVIKNATSEDNFEKKVAVNAQDYFVLKATNGQVIGKSEMYKSKASMENGIKSVIKNAQMDVVVKDLTA